MADLKSFVPIFLNLETGVILKENETVEDLFERAKKEGYNTSLSVCGINFDIYDDYNKSKGINETNPILLKLINFKEWYDIFNKEFWDKCKASKIKSQRIANFIADWYFSSNIECIRQLNKCLLDTDEYEVTNKLIKRINSYNEDELLDNILIPCRTEYTNALNINKAQKEHFIERFNKI